MIFEVYKANQGKYTRLGSAFSGVLVVGLGCWQLSQKIDAGIWIKIMTPVVVFVVLSCLCFWLVNKPSIADFMISSEGEMKKVNWSSRKEIAVSTLL